MTKNKLIWIPHNIPSLKNSKIKTSRGVFMSKTTKKFLQKIGIQKYSVRRKEVVEYKTRPNTFRDIEKDFKKQIKGKNPPIKIGFHFVRGTKHKFDFHNAVQILADLLVAHNYINDDDMDEFLPFPMKLNNKWYSYDKEKPGVYIKIL